MPPWTAMRNSFSPPPHPTRLPLVRSARPPSHGVAVVEATPVVPHTGARVQPVAGIHVRHRPGLPPLVTLTLPPVPRRDRLRISPPQELLASDQ
jgi:hypothetical protein